MSPMPSTPCTFCAVLEWDPQRGLGPGVHRDVVTAAQLAGVERVLHRELERDVAGDDADPDHVDVGVAERDDEGDRIVGGGVGVDEERTHRSAGYGVGPVRA
jgi:hypothetical protein